MSSTNAPRERSFTGRFYPCNIGPMGPRNAANLVGIAEQNTTGDAPYPAGCCRLMVATGMVRGDNDGKCLIATRAPTGFDGLEEPKWRVR